MRPGLSFLLALLLSLTAAPPAGRAANDGGAAGDPEPAVASLPEAKPGSFSAAASPDKVRLGERFQYVIEVHHAPAERYELPHDLSLGESFNLIDVAEARETKNGQTRTRFVLTAAIFDLGEKPLPDLALVVTAPAAQQLTIPGPTITGLGELAEDEQAELRDIHPPVDVAIRDWRPLLAVGAGLLVTLLALLLFRALKRRTPRAKVTPLPPPVPAHQRALDALAALQREDPQGREKELFFRISEIVRDYLGERFGFSALDLTTAELLAALRRVPTQGLDYTGFETFCRETDLVKFARLEASPGMVKSALDQATGFVQATAPAVPGTGTRAEGGRA